VGRTARRVDQRRAAPDAPSAAVPPRPSALRRYVWVPWKLALAQAVALGWLGVSIWLSLPWGGPLRCTTLGMSTGAAGTVGDSR
jgi:hypothetical protein